MPVSNQLNGSNQPHAANLTHQWVIGKLLKSLAKDHTHLSSMLNQPFLFDDFKIL